jgi:hypothetical protein
VSIINRQEFHVEQSGDNELNSSRTIGRVCPKHTELSGLRYRGTHACVGCQRDYRKKSRLRPEAKAKRLEVLKRKRDAHELNEEWKRSIRLRAEKLCIEAGHSTQAAEHLSGRFWNEARRQLNEEHKARHKTDVSVSEMLGAKDDAPGGPD